MIPRVRQNQRLQQVLSSPPIMILVVLAVTAWFGWWLGIGNETTFGKLVLLSTGAAFAYAVWQKPYLGLIATVTSLPLQSLLPEIPFATSAISALGGLTLLALVYQRKRQALFSYGPQLQLVLAGAFVIWQFVSFPRASFFGMPRNWLWTYLQLWIILWLGSELMTPDRQRTMMRAYVTACVISGLYAFSQANIVADFSAGSGLERGGGLAENQNTLAFYLNLGFVMTAFLHRQSKHRLSGLIYPFTYLALIMGIVGTVSRAGFLTLVLAIVLVIVFWLTAGQRRLRPVVIMVLTLVVVAVYVVPDTYWQVLENTLFSADVTEEGNFGNRQALITAAIEVWKDYPTTGVGIGQFRTVNRDYLPLEYYRSRGSVPHNFYATLLAETGLIGFLLYAGWILISIYQLWRTIRLRSPRYTPLAMVWLILFGLFLFRGYTASTMHYDKLLWLMGGMSILLYHAARAEHKVQQNEDSLLQRMTSNGLSET